MPELNNHTNLEGNITLELVRTTEAAAIASARFLGLGDKEKVDQAAVECLPDLLSCWNIHKRILVWNTI